MTTEAKAAARATGLILIALVAVIGSASAQNGRHGVIFARPVTSSDLNAARPRGLFFTDTDPTLDYNSYSYDDRYHGPSPSYDTRYFTAPNYFYAPGHPMYRYSAGGTLYYWPRANHRR